jgi:molybdate transport system permease protein
VTEAAWSAILLTLTVAGTATAIAFVPAVLLGYLFARRDSLWSHVAFTILELPMVLPPTAVGYLLLRLLADNGPLGPTLFGWRLNWLLTWQAAVLAAVVMSFPIVVRMAKVAFENVDPQLESISHTLGRAPTRTFLTVSMPLAARGLLAAAILGFTRAVGEFGATITVAGNLPGKTQTLATAIYSSQQAGQRSEATFLIVFALAIGFMAIFATELLIRRTSMESRRA